MPVTGTICEQHYMQWSVQIHYNHVIILFLPHLNIQILVISGSRSFAPLSLMTGIVNYIFESCWFITITQKQHPELKWGNLLANCIYLHHLSKVVSFGYMHPTRFPQICLQPLYWSHICDPSLTQMIWRMVEMRRSKNLYHDPEENGQGLMGSSHPPHLTWKSVVGNSHRPHFPLWWSPVQNRKDSLLLQSSSGLPSWNRQDAPTNLPTKGKVEK